MIKKGAGHSEILLKEISIETKKELKALDELPEFTNLLFSKGNNDYKNKKKGILLYSRYIYIMAKEILEAGKPKYFVFDFCGFNIEIDEKSLVHILTQHFSPMTRPHKFPVKSFFQMDISPRTIHLQLAEMFTKIEKSGLFNAVAANNPQFKLEFRYKDTPYRIWVNERKKSVQGQQEPVKYLAIGTFHPIEESDELKELENMSLNPIDGDFSLYQSK